MVPRPVRSSSIHGLWWASAATIVFLLTGCGAEAGGDSSQPGDCALNGVTLATAVVMLDDPASLPVGGGPRGWVEVAFDREQVSAEAFGLPLPGEVRFEVPERAWEQYLERSRATAATIMLLRRNSFGDHWMGALSFGAGGVAALDCDQEWTDVTEPFERGMAALDEREVIGALERLARSDGSRSDELFALAWQPTG